MKDKQLISDMAKVQRKLGNLRNEFGQAKQATQEWFERKVHNTAFEETGAYEQMEAVEQAFEALKQSIELVIVSEQNQDDDEEAVA